MVHSICRPCPGAAASESSSQPLHNLRNLHPIHFHNLAPPSPPPDNRNTRPGNPKSLGQKLLNCVVGSPALRRGGNAHPHGSVFPDFDRISPRSRMDSDINLRRRRQSHCPQSMQGVTWYRFQLILRYFPTVHNIICHVDRHTAICLSERHNAICHIERHTATCHSDRHNTICHFERHNAICLSERYTATCHIERHNTICLSERHNATCNFERHNTTRLSERHNATCHFERHNAICLSERHNTTCHSERHNATCHSERSETESRNLQGITQAEISGPGKTIWIQY